MRVLTNYCDLERFLASRAIPFCRDVALSDCSTARIGGPADYLVRPSAAEDISLLLRFVRQRDIPLVAVGRGSNLLFSDEGVRGVVLKLNGTASGVSIDGTTVVAQSGVFMPRLAHRLGLAGLSGLEHTVGIPGSLGGLLAMNGGSQRRSIGDVIDWVKCVDADGNAKTYDHDQCQFAYRHSIFLERSSIILEAGLTLARADTRLIRRDMAEILRSRRNKFPLQWPSCGSVFKSSPALFERLGPPGAIIDRLGLKTLSVGDAAVSEQHANFIINRGRARARDVLTLIDRVRTVVRRQTGVVLESEVRLVRADGTVGAI